MPRGEPSNANGDKTPQQQAAINNARAVQQVQQSITQATPAQLAAIRNPYPQGGLAKDAQGNATFTLPYPNAPHDGGPQDLANTQAISQQGGQAASNQAAYNAKPGFIDKLIPALAIGMATAGVGAGVGGAIGDTLGATAGNIAGGATAGGLGAAVQGQNPLKATLLGGLGGGLSTLASPVTGALTNAGLNPALASGLVRGGIGAGVGALGGALTGGNIGNSALSGGIGGAASGIIGNMSGSQQLGNVAGTIGGALANKYLGSQAPAAKAPAVSAPAAPSALPNLPSAPGMSQTGNIGAYSGYAPSNGAQGLGYQPRQQANMSGTDWAHYGQGPEQQFFQPSQQQPQVNAAPVNYNAMPVMSNINQGALTPQNRV